jgi:predicted secreted protein
MKVLIPILLTVSLAAAPAAVSAQSPVPAATAKPPSTSDDPNKLICQKLEMIGSRIAVKKVCLTQYQWQDARLQDRQLVEKIQASPCVTTHTVQGRPSC